MKNPLVVLLLGVGLLAVTGCQNFEHRAKQKAALFATLDDATQARLRGGEIRLGDSEDQVYLARGKPDEKKLTTTASGETNTWVYNRYWQEYRGEIVGGFQPRVRRDPTGATTSYMEPVYRPIYADRVQAVLRVTFTEGKVSAIERPQS